MNLGGDKDVSFLAPDAGRDEDVAANGDVPIDSTDSGLAGLPDCAWWDGSFDAGVPLNQCALDGGDDAGLAPFEVEWESCGYVDREFALKDEVLYFSVPGFHDTRVLAINKKGEVLFETNLSGAVSFPAVGGDDIAYVDHGGVEIMGFRSTGKKAVIVKILDEKPNSTWVSDPAIGKDGTVYVSLNWMENPADVPAGASQKTQYVLASVKNGRVVWRDKSYASPFEAEPIIDTDGTLFVTQFGVEPKEIPLGTTMVTKWALLKALGVEGGVKWALDLKWKEVHATAQPMVLGNKVVYVRVDEKLFSVRNCGEKLWEVTLPDYHFTQGPVSLRVDSRGNIIIGASLNSSRFGKQVAVFYVIDFNGKIIAHRSIDGLDLNAAALLLSDGTFLVGGSKLFENGGKSQTVAQIYRFDTDLNIVEERSWPSTTFPIRQIGFGGCGEMYMVASKFGAGRDSAGYCLYKIRVSPSLGVADAPWPLERGDMARTGRVNVKGN